VPGNYASGVFTGTQTKVYATSLELEQDADHVQIELVVSAIKEKEQ
jgi:hypothetical protein